MSTEPGGSGPCTESEKRFAHPEGLGGKGSEAAEDTYMTAERVLTSSVSVLH